MTVDLTLLGVAAAAALLYNFAVPSAARQGVILGLSLTALFWLQPPLPIRWSGFLLPLFLLFLIAFSWWATLPAEKKGMDRQSWATAAFIAVLVIALATVRYLPVDLRPTLNRPPGLESVLAILAVGGLLLAAAQRFGAGRVARWTAASAIIILFIGLKWPWLTARLSGGWRAVMGQNPALAAATDLSWLGFSYIAFRLLHTIRDRFTGQLPEHSLGEFFGYTLFFPALLAGPIDRAERFQRDWQKLPALSATNWVRWQNGLSRIALGMGKKFIIADSLAFGLSLTPALGSTVDRPGWLWFLLYGYAWRLYLDFSGYTDMAIGFGLLFGIELPENFKRPYWQPSITAFWQSWHITLSDWVRFYVFSPLSRTLLRRKPRPSTWSIIFISQLTTMLIIGLWHGITLNFFIWGAWHGIGLFIHKMWSDRTRRWYRSLGETPRLLSAWTWLGRLLTFHYVVIGWVWFVMPEFDLAVDVLLKLVGVSR